MCRICKWIRVSFQQLYDQFCSKQPFDPSEITWEVEMHGNTKLESIPDFSYLFYWRRGQVHTTRHFFKTSNPAQTTKKWE